MKSLLSVKAIVSMSVFLASSSVTAQTVLSTDAYIKSISVKQIRGGTIYNYGNSGYRYEGEVIVLTLENEVTCDDWHTTQLRRMDEVTTNTVLVIPNEYQSNYNNSDQDNDSNGDGRYSRQFLASMSLLSQAMSDHSPVTFGELWTVSTHYLWQGKIPDLLAYEDDGDSYTTIQAGYTYHTRGCVVDPRDITVSAQPSLDAAFEGAEVSSGGTIENAIDTNWGFSIPAAGNYQLYAHWVLGRNLANSYAYDIDSTGTATTDTIQRSVSTARHAHLARLLDCPSARVPVFWRAGVLGPMMAERYNALVTVTRLVGVHPKLGDFRGNSSVAVASLHSTEPCLVVGSLHSEVP